MTDPEDVESVEDEDLFKDKAAFFTLSRLDFGQIISQEERN